MFTVLVSMALLTRNRGKDNIVNFELLFEENARLSINFFFSLKELFSMAEIESNPKDKTPFAAVMPRSSSFTSLSAENHSQRLPENECSIENMTYEQLLQLQYRSHKPIIRQPVCTYSIPKTLKSSHRKNRSENPYRNHIRAQENNGNEKRDDFDAEEIDLVEQSICNIDSRCCDTDKKFTGKTSAGTNCDVTVTENDPEKIERSGNEEMLTNVTDKFEGKQFKADKQSDKDDHNDHAESKEISIQPNVLLQGAMDGNEKVTNFLKGLPEMTSTTCNLKSVSCEETNATTSDDPVDIHPVRSTSGELVCAEDFESCGSDTDVESGV